jgi:hypothetical protein
MKKEFMLLVRNTGDAKKTLSPEEHLAFIKKCETYIAGLSANGNLLAAQPLVREGLVISKKGTGWNTATLAAGIDVQVGYYHVLANDMDEAIAIAKNNPEFEYVPSATIEVRPIKMKEEKTGFVYPGKEAQ